LPRYRYTADGRLVDGTWHVKVEGFPGIVEASTQGEALIGASTHAARHLNVSPEDVSISMTYWRPPANETWRDRTEFYPRGEHTVTCRIFQGGDVLEAVTELQNWLATNVDQLGSQTDSAGLIPINAVFAYDWTQRLGDAPVEISLYYETEQLNPHALTLASNVVAELLALGISATITEDSNADRAAIALTEHPRFQFAVEPSANADIQPWDTSIDGLKIVSDLDALTGQSSAQDVARAIQATLSPNRT
jgi:hypothetical protein